MQKNKLILTEKELIELTMKYDYNGSELKNPHFLEKGFLKKNGTYDSFIKKVESICDKWSRLKKKKGQPVMYEIINLYEKAIPILDNRTSNGKKLTEADLIMKDHIQFTLAISEINDGKAHSLNRWATLFGLASNSELEKISKTDILKEKFSKKEVEKIVETFKSTIIKRNKDVVSNSFKHLEKQNKIKKNEVPIFIHLDNSISSPSQTEYDEVDLEKDKILAANKITRNDLYQNHFNKSVIKAKSEIDYMLNSKGLKNIFIGYQVEVIEPISKEQLIDKQQFRKAYADRLIELTLLRENNPAYQVNFIEKRFYIFNTLFLLRELGFPVKNKLIERYEPAQSDVKAIRDSQKVYAIKEREHYKLQYAFSNRIKDEERLSWGFRKIYL
ncbi:hypothetical protein JOC25_001002 [Solibacillus kalamii]|uniref:Uncharacterized protein n=1 Tax=Solibacillus kalamii TaxID=1748298 RepID=A0ABX3ZIZ2_9BACL|nr:hypothetical protein [Solibacillus kalamii]MBM7664546.1 hypothetical protein [Solibacillus kalamii]OUZ39705.1 hypothetical protein CBM15_04135 [Solibacillus kalamii]